jgi:hypothetical protein
MPRSPKGEKRPADVNALAIMIGKIAAGENEDVTTDDGKNAAAVALGAWAARQHRSHWRWRHRRCPVQKQMAPDESGAAGVSVYLVTPSTSAADHG